jgi:hypothetical protein
MKEDNRKRCLKMNLEDLRKILIELYGKKVRLTTKRSTYVDVLNRNNYMYVTCGFSSVWNLPRVFDLTDILSVEVVE